MIRPPPRRVRTSPCVIGLDPSLTNFAYVVRSEGKVLRADTFSTGKLRGMARVCAIMERLWGLLHTYPDAIVVREDYAFASHSGSDTALKELGGVMAFSLWEKHITLHTVGIAQIKKFVAGKGNAQKDQMMLAVYKNFGFEPADEHQADAFGVAITAEGLLSRSGATAPQREVIAAAVKAGHPLTLLPK